MKTTGNEYKILVEKSEGRILGTTIVPYRLVARQ
jgi:hypothetical protein